MTDESEPTIADLMKAFRKGNTDTQKKLESIEKSINANQKTFEDYIKSNDKTGKKLQGKLTKLEDTVKTLEDTVNTLSDNVVKLRKENETYTKKFDDLSKAGMQMDEDKRKANLIIEGLKENKNKHPRKQAMDLLEEIGVNIPAESILTASRLGPVNPNSRRPRHILLRFISPFWKQEVFRNTSKAKDSPIKHKGHDFNCAEQAYVYNKAEDAGDQRAMTKVRKCKNG